MAETESFFWTHFTDTYIELAKTRARSETDPAGRGSAVAALRLGLKVLLRLFAPFQPHVTEEVLSWAYAEETAQPSIHRAPWPSETDFEAVAAPDHELSFEIATTCWGAINKRKADEKVSMGREVVRLGVAANAGTLARLEVVREDVMAGARVHEHRVEERAGLEDGVFEIVDIEFAER